MVNNAFSDRALYKPVPCCRHTGTARADVAPCLTAEHILTLSAGQTRLQRFTCSPAQLAELCLGWLCAEGYITAAEDAEELQISADGSTAAVVLNGLRQRSAAPFSALADVDEALCARAADILLKGDSTYTKTRGTHGCVYAAPDGSSIFCEDIGRNNAMDKVVGSLLLQGKPAGEGLLFSSGRVTADIVRKAVRAGIPVLVTKATVTADAVAAAAQYRLRLAFFADGETYVLPAD
ncbi:MAG: hypothetical protein E7429_04025 [Ruminococcaceae bacterium]|nr:hypothetical protein [Oscillospiraceae bacterium]